MNFKRYLFILAIIILTIIPRVYKLGWDFHSIDSDRWFRRSVAFQENFFTHHNFSGTYQKQHPGVSLMWLGGTGYRVLNRIYPKIVGGVPDENEAKEFPIINLAIKLPLVMADIFLIGVSVLLIAKLYNKKTLWLYLLLVLCDPFFFFYTRQFHLDVLLSLLSLNATLFFILGSRATKRKNDILFLVLSGIFSGLAFLTKTPALGIIAGIGLAIIIRNIKHPKKLVLDGILFALTVLLTYLIVFPANWVNPIETTRQIIVDSITNTKEWNTIYLLNAPFSNPGPSLYLIFLIFRFWQVSLVLAVVGLAMGIAKRVFRHSGESRLAKVGGGMTPESVFRTSGTLAFIGYAIVALMLLKDTKIYERYLLIFVPAIALFNARFWSKYFSEKVLKVILIVGLLLFSFFQIRRHPNYLTYPNGLISEDFQLKIFSEMGACEGPLYQVADFINKKESYSQDYEAGISGVYRLCLKPFLSGSVTVLDRDDKMPEYIIIYKTDTLWTQSNRWFRENFKLIKSFYVSQTPVYYLYERNNRP